MFVLLCNRFEEWERESKSNPSSARGESSSLPSDGALMAGYGLRGVVNPVKMVEMLR